MCGRTALTLGKDDLLKKCVIKRKKKSREASASVSDPPHSKPASSPSASGQDPGEEIESCNEPVWREAPCGGTYSPSPNIAPTVYTPILYRTREGVTVLQPMMWGLIPPWHPGPSPKTHGLSTNNCRLEGLGSSKLYSPCLRSGRCVVVCQGFYEWCRQAGKKTPYLVRRRPGDQGDPEPLLYMAGLMSVWQDTVHSYTIITRESNDTLAWLHHRMPAFLRPEQVGDWLDTDTDTALTMLDAGMPGEGDLIWYRVSQDVGNSRNQNPDLMNKVEEKKEKKLPGLMANWLQSSPSTKTNGRTLSPSVTKKKEDKSKTLMNSWLKRGNDSDESSVEKRSKL